MPAVASLPAPSSPCWASLRDAAVAAGVGRVAAAAAVAVVATVT